MEFQHPFSALISGGRKSGKTVFTTKLLREGSRLIKPPPERIVWCYTKHQKDLYAELKSINKDIEYLEGIPSDLSTMFDSKTNNLIILDDMMDEGSKDERVSQLFTRGRHDNLSVLFLTQNLFHKNQRSISLNSEYIVLFKNARDQSQIYNLARQFMPTNSKFLVWAYQDATSEPHSYLLLDLTPSMIDKFRVRARIFSHELPEIIYIPNK